MLADELIAAAGSHEDAIMRGALSAMAKRLRGAQAFDLAPEVMRSAFTISHSPIGAQLRALPLCRLPFRSTWFEWLGGIGAPTTRENAPIPKRMGALVETDESLQRGTIAYAWHHLEMGVNICPLMVTFDWRGAPLADIETPDDSWRNATAEHVDVQQGGIMRLDAQDVAVNMGGIGLARGDRVSVELGGLGLGLARELRLTQGAARTVLAREAHVDQGLIGTVIAGQARFERNTGMLILIAGRVEGNVRTLLDWRGALAFGAAIGVALGLLRRR